LPNIFFDIFFDFQIFEISLILLFSFIRFWLPLLRYFFHDISSHSLLLLFMLSFHFFALTLAYFFLWFAFRVSAEAGLHFRWYFFSWFRLISFRYFSLFSTLIIFAHTTGLITRFSSTDADDWGHFYSFSLMPFHVYFSIIEGFPLVSFLYFTFLISLHFLHFRFAARWLFSFLFISYFISFRRLIFIEPFRLTFFFFHIFMIYFSLAYWFLRHYWLHFRHFFIIFFILPLLFRLSHFSLFFFFLSFSLAASLFFHFSSIFILHFSLISSIDTFLLPYFQPFDYFALLSSAFIFRYLHKAFILASFRYLLSFDISITTIIHIRFSSVSIFFIYFHFLRLFTFFNCFSPYFHFDYSSQLAFHFSSPYFLTFRWIAFRLSIFFTHSLRRLIQLLSRYCYIIYDYIFSFISSHFLRCWYSHFSSLLPVSFISHYFISSLFHISFHYFHFSLDIISFYFFLLPLISLSFRRCSLVSSALAHFDIFMISAIFLFLFIWYWLASRFLLQLWFSRFSFSFLILISHIIFSSLSYFDFIFSSSFSSSLH